MDERLLAAPILIPLATAFFCARGTAYFPFGAGAFLHHRHDSDAGVPVDFGKISVFW